MARRAKEKEVVDYRHDEATRLNNPPAGLAREDIEAPPKRRFEYDPHLPPELFWAGKDASESFEVEAPSIHVHEMLSTDAIIRAAKREDPQPALFGDPELDRSQAVEFYEHEMGWTNRLILGDSLHVMTSLVERERLAGQIQMIYIDPPYGINFNSNFQARISNRAPRETKDASMTREPEQIQAYRDTWELGIHSYLTYMYTRLTVSRDLLNESGSIFVQIGPDNLHLVRTLLDEIFGPENQCPFITVQKTSGHDSSLLPEVCDYLVWYARDKAAAESKFRHLFGDRPAPINDPDYRRVEMADGSRRNMTKEERANPGLLPADSRIFRYDQITSEGSSRRFDFEFRGESRQPPRNRQWAIREEGMKGLNKAKRLDLNGNTLSYVRYHDDFAGIRRTNVWTDVTQAGARGRRKQFVVETNPKIVERCIAMTTDPGDLVLDPTCGSGTTAWCAEKLGRRWITIDTSRVAAALARERLLTGKFDYYKLKDEKRGVDGGFEYDELERITASSIGYGRDPETEILYDRPKIERSRIRVSGPFTFEALSRYADDPFTDPAGDGARASTDEGADHIQILLDALQSHGIPRHEGKPLPIESLSPLSGSTVIHAEGTCRDEGSEEKRFVVSLGPRHGAITVAQVDEALHEAPGYDLVVFAGFAAHAEAQEYLRPGKRGRIDVALLEANPDLLLGDLLKNTQASQTFRLYSAPEATVARDPDSGYQVEVQGMDSFDAATGEVRSVGQDEIAAWFLDHDYDGSVFHVNQAFFTRDDAWKALTRAIKGIVDEGLMDQLKTFKSLPFRRGETGKCAIRVIDDAGSVSEAVLELPD